MPQLQGQAILSWTPTAGDVGARDIDITVTDSGLGPQDAGFEQGTGQGSSTPLFPVANVTVHRLRVVVRTTNATPELLGVQVNGTQVTDTGNATTPVQINATEGSPLSIELFGRDTDTDLINWSAASLPRGMTLQVPSNGNSTRAVLNWTPDLFAAQDNFSTGNGTQAGAGLWRFTVNGSDGMSTVTRTFEIAVANFNQTPRILPMPLQLVNEGELLSFTLRTADADADVVRTTLIYDENTPAGVSFDGNTGYFEWTPGQDIVNNATQNNQSSNKAYTFNFRATDGTATTTQSVQVRVFDVNRVPRLTAGNHAVVVGQTLSIPVRMGPNTSVSTSANVLNGDIVAADDDGTAQTQALAISFTGLPEGASYDAQTQRLNWTPGPGQVGDFVIFARASDGRNTITRSFTVRAVADAAANAPSITVSTTPSTPALPGQVIVTTVRADAYSPIATVEVQVRGAALQDPANAGTSGSAGNADTWQTVALDSAGRLALTPTQPGLIEVRVTATDRDGFSSTRTHTVRVKDPADLQAPALAWMGSLIGASALGAPVNITESTPLQMSLQERQLMGYKLEIAPASMAGNSTAWQTLAEQSALATDSNFAATLATLDPSLFANGVYQVRLSAWDLVGRTTTIDARVIIDTAQKNLGTATATDASYVLAGHTLALNRSLDNKVGSGAAATSAEFGNWVIPALDTRLTTDQAEFTPSGATAAWQVGARVWLQVPSDFATPSAAQQYLSFTLDTTTERLGTEPNAPQVWHPVFTTSQGWTLEAHGEEDYVSGANAKPDNLLRQGHKLYSQVTGLPWVPTSYTLTGPDGTRTTLDATGKVTRVAFADGAQWLVSDAGIAAVGADTVARVDFIKDSAGRISRITGPGDTANSDAKTTVYRYDTQGRLILARALNAPDFGTPYGYDAAGKPFAETVNQTITANLGAATNWLANSTQNQWAGTLQSGQTTALSFAVRESELASSIKTPGAGGAVIIALESSLADAQGTVQVTGATVLGTSTVGGIKTTLLRVTEAGLKLIRITGVGAAQVRVSIAGDINRDGTIDGLDSAAWVQAAQASASVGDLTGDGLVKQTDRQVLYANYGFRANQAPIAASVLPVGKTHTDLATTMALNTVAQDLEGDQVLWRIVGATHGSARFSADGQSVLFTPELGFVGQATITVQGDDGFAASSPIALTVNVSGAKLLAIHLAPLPSLRPGASAVIKATADFADEKGVNVSASSSYLTVTTADLSGMGLVGTPQVQADDSRDLIRATGSGPALVVVSRMDIDGRVVRAVTTVNALNNNSESEALQVQPDVYPGTLALTPGGTRQLKVHLLDQPSGAANADIHTASQTVFVGSPEQVLDYLDPSTQDPLLDPITGEVMLDPDTGEVLLDPNTGTTIHVVIPATPPVYSGTRYIVSDESIATVSADGLITALRDGEVTVSIIHLASETDTYGRISQQVIGQSNISLMVQTAQLTDEDDATPAPRTIAVSKELGGVVAAATGETVMMGAGALAQDAAIAIHRISVDDIAAQAGMAIPGAGVLQAVGAFKLDMGDKPSNYPLQLAIPVQNNIATQLGDEVLFFRKGTVITPGGGFKATWWLVDNGYVGADGVARTASPPYGGLDSEGEYVVCKRIPGVIGGVFDLGIGGGSWADFGNFCLGGGLFGVNITSEVVGILATMAGSIGGGSYRFGVPQFSKDIVIPTIPVGDTFNIRFDDYLPTAVTPYGNVQLPTVTDASVNDAGEMHINVQAVDAGKFKGTLVLRALLADGSSIDVQTLAGDVNGDITVTPPANIAIGSVRWQLVRLIPQNVLTGSGNLSSEPPLEFGGNVLRISPKPLMAAVLNRTGITFMREEQPLTTTALVGMLGQPNNFNGQYITGTKVQPVAYSDDLSRVYVAGNGVIYVIDTLSYKLLEDIKVPAGMNIVSLMNVGGLLFIGEGNGYGAAPSNARLLAMRTTPGSKGYNEPVTIKGTGIEKSPLGITGMAAGPDGRTLVVATPNQGTWYAKQVPGDLLVFDLDTLDMDTGKIAAPVKADLPSSYGKAPQTITATSDPAHFLVANIKDYNSGLGTLVITRDDNDKITSAKLSNISLNQPANAIRRDRLNIQRAQSAVLVEKDGVEYAIVSDDNHPFDDPYVRAMYEVPEFIQLSPFGPPTPIGGSASAKKVSAGGKLGFVKDPFGKLGEPVFMGATLPLDGYGIVNLSLSPDGKVLLGQLKGGFSANIFDGAQRENQNHVWNVDLLLEAVLAHPDADRMSKHIKPDASAELRLPETGTGYLAAPVGTFFDAPHVQLTVQGNMGDVIGIDLPRQIATQLLLAEKAISEVDAKTPWDKLSTAKQNLINLRAAKISVTIERDSLNLLTALKDPSKPQPGMSLITDGKDAKGNPIVLSRKNTDGSGGAATFGDPGTGVLFLTPDLSKDDIADLRSGKSLKQPKAGRLNFTYVDNANPGASDAEKSGKGTLDVTAEEPNSDSRVFMGDRPLDNPGYSQANLSGAIGKQTNAIDRLDIYKIEQRLRYFGYGISSIKGSGEIKQDGKIDDAEKIVLRQFHQIVQGDTEYQDTEIKQVPAPTKANPNATAPKKVALPPITLTNDDINWLNAYNAPHWMQYNAEFAKKLTGWVDKTSGATTLKMATSWVFDLMLNSQNAAKTLARKSLWFSGTSSLGTQLNLGVNTDYISKPNQNSVYADEFLIGLGDVNSVDLKSITASNAANATAQETEVRHLFGEIPVFAPRPANEFKDLPQFSGSKQKAIVVARCSV